MLLQQRVLLNIGLVMGLNGMGNITADETWVLIRGASPIILQHDGVVAVPCDVKGGGGADRTV